ncbi:MAG: RagB/SusD family nutrient uptake outer membrane protein, partial [Tannerellaceae bacterium]|nr:RagB/SusD family nutrient uptake outer membrane protein [Tannerellaceae bacterium]
MNAKIYSIIAVILLATSCDSAFLEREPSNGVDVTIALQTTADLSDAVNGLYAAVKSSSFLGRDVQVLNDLLGDNDFISTNNYGRFLAENAYTFSQSSGSSSGIWSQGYYVILQANRIIYADLPSDDAVNHLKGEAYAIRGLSYLVLVNFFSPPYALSSLAPGVPLVTLPTFVTGTSSVPARNTVA